MAAEDSKTPEEPPQPVQTIPLVLPNNMKFDVATGTMTQQEGEERTSLVLQDEAVAVLKSLPRDHKIAVVAVVGRERTGKSSAASTLAAPQVVPAAFELGSTMDKCTVGIWMSCSVVPHPLHGDVEVLVLDVEGIASAAQRTEHDSKLIILSLLLGSLLVFSVTDANLPDTRLLLDCAGAVRGPAETKPQLLWLFRDMDESPSVEGKEATFCDYLTQHVLPAMDPSLNEAIHSYFSGLTAYGLPTPVAHEDLLVRLGAVAQDQLNPAFRRALEFLPRQVMPVVQAKSVPFEGLLCGPDFARWAATCVDAVNSFDAPQGVSVESLACKLPDDEHTVRAAAAAPSVIIMTEHKVPEVDFSQQSVPAKIRALPYERQVEVVARMYDHKLFRYHPKRPFLGGGVVLAIKNFKHCKNERMLSPQDMGFSILEPKGPDDHEYSRTLLCKVRNGDIEIVSFTAHTGSFYSLARLRNTTDQRQEFNLPTGQVFQQKFGNRVQNMKVITGIYRQILEPGEVKAFKVDCYCMDKDFKAPKGEEVDLTPLLMPVAPTQDEDWGQFM